MPRPQRTSLTKLAFLFLSGLFLSRAIDAAITPWDGSRTLIIQSVSPQFAAPGSLVTIEVRSVAAAASASSPTSVYEPMSASGPLKLQASFDGLVGDQRGLAELPGSLVVRVPGDILASSWKFSPPFYKIKKPLLVVFSSKERSDPYTDFTVQAPFLGPWAVATIGLLLFMSVALIISRRLLAWPLNKGLRNLVYIFTPSRSIARSEAREESPLPDAAPPDRLVQDCAVGECVVYVGAGLSAASGYPVWSGLVSEILEWAIEKRYVERDFGDSLRSALREGDADLVADSVVGSLQGREEVLSRHLQKLFIQDNRPLSRAHRLIREIPFGAALTTNFDELLEKNLGKERPVYTPEDTDRLREDLSGRRFFLLKLYGSLRKPSTLIVSPAQYRESIGGNRAFSQAMEGLFFSRTILFVGASLQGIEAYLGGLSFRGIARRQHYALVAVTGTAWRAKADLLSRRYGIQVIPYQPSTPSHPEVIDFLSDLRDRIRVESKSIAQRGTGPELFSGRSQVLTRVRLENVGAFEELDVELDPHWTVLLGDNGVGKSTVLEAIAAVICGKDAEPHARPLIRMGTRTARIVLSAGTREYMATLSPREGGYAEIEVTPSRPLETEGWLAIGFPPLRAVTWSRSKGPSPEGKRRPTTEDLLPLLKGGVDPRLDELKQWLVNLDYWSKNEPSGSGNRYNRLRDDFFVMANKLTQGVPLRFEKIDEFTHQVTVMTDDGSVPIEALSQGTASLIGWTGFMLQRLHEVYGQQDGDPQKRHALILIDELDAHMHPAWQQALVERLSNAFPGAQFVASTHSPLIAGSLQASSILRFHRENGRVMAERPNESVKGWRVDQILTAPLFGLHTGRESETQRLLMTYMELAGRDDLNELERSQLLETAETLNVRLPEPEERKEARTAYELLESGMRDRLRSMTLEEQEKVLNEAKVQLQEAVTGSRRPA